MSVTAQSIDTSFSSEAAGTLQELSRKVVMCRVMVLVAAVLLVTLFHYSTATQYEQLHDVYRRLYYLPIILGGIWFRTKGGVVTAIVVSAIYAPHVLFQWGQHPSGHLDHYLEILLYNIVGLLTGILSEKEWRQRQQLKKTADDLEHSYTHLKKQAEIILEFEDQLVRISRLSALGELSAGLAHEIRNPLGSIRGTAEILANSIRNDDKHAEFAKIMIKEVDRLNEVLENFLRFASPSPVEKKRFDLNDTLEELLVLTRQECDRLKLEIEIEKGDLPTIPGDKSQLKQVFLNFVLNAGQAMTNGGQLWISTHVSGDAAIIQFRDNGSGIKEKLLDKIFNPFFTTKSDGVGLGLAITHRIVKAHGGRIDVESSEGAGTTFKVLLPLDES